MGNHSALTDDEYAALSGILHREYGIDLDEHSADTVLAKIERYRERRTLASVAACISEILHDESRALDIGDIVYSQATHFNRCPDHFDLLIDVVLRTQRERRLSAGDELSIWSLGCSTGQ